MDIRQKALIALGAVVATSGVLTAGLQIGRRHHTVAGAPSAASGSVAVHVSGAVRQPGLVTLREGSRVSDAVQAAGGLAPDAAPDGVNLAAPVRDGDQVYVPDRAHYQPAVLSEPSAPVSGVPSQVSSGLPASSPLASRTTVPGGMVDINTASLAELDTLPGVGPVTAQRIIEYRTANGPFRTPDDLINVKGIGPKKLQKMRDRIRVGGQ